MVDRGVRWKCSEGGCLKLDTNASLRAGSGASIDGILRDGEGQVVWCYCERCHVTDVAFVDASAIRRCLEYARDRGVRDLEVESDAQVVIFPLLQFKWLSLPYFRRG